MNVLIRIASLLLGCFLLADAILPATHETAVVANHEFSKDTTWDREATHKRTETHYWLHLVGGAKRCDVDESSYGRIRDGDKIDIKRSALINTCLYVAANNEVIYSDKIASIGFPILGLLLFAVAFGMISTDFWRRNDADDS